MARSLTEFDISGNYRVKNHICEMPLKSLVNSRMPPGEYWPTVSAAPTSGQRTKNICPTFSSRLMPRKSASTVSCRGSGSGSGSGTGSGGLSLSTGASIPAGSGGGSSRRTSRKTPAAVRPASSRRHSLMTPPP